MLPPPWPFPQNLFAAVAMGVCGSFGLALAIIGIRCLIEEYRERRREPEQAFRNSIDDYLDFRRGRNEPPTMDTER